jgi:hypothetical protein
MSHTLYKPPPKVIEKGIINVIVINAFGVFMVGNFDRYHGGYFVLALVVGSATRYSVVDTPPC